MDLINISKKQFAREASIMTKMVSYLDGFGSDNSKILKNSYEMIKKVRSSDSGVSVEAFLNKYNLSTKEGVALMCLAEALLRIPDKKTADKLIESTFKGTDWNQYLGDSDSFYFNAASWGMLLTGKTLELGYNSEEKPLTILRNIFKKTYEPVIRKALESAMHIIATQFVMGENIDQALKKASKFEKIGYSFSYDILGEGARNQKQADRYFASYKEAIEKVAKYHSKTKEHDIFKKSGVSIKLTALHPRYELLKKERVYNELLPKIVELIRFAKSLDIAVSIDAEEARRLDIELEIFKEICSMSEFKNYNGIGFVLQAYQKRSFYVIDFLLKIAKSTNRIIPIRLVKGAYWDSEIKYAQINGLKHYPVFTNKYHSDVSYLACARKILDNCQRFYPQFATHNAYSIAAIKEYATKNRYEFQRLYGMGEKLYEDVVKDVPCRIYAPIGEHKDLLAYLIRRLLENGANSSFVHLLLDKKVPVENVVEDPILKVKNIGGRRNKTIPLPSQIYGDERNNSKGIDIGNISQISSLEKELNKFIDYKWHFENKSFSGNKITVKNPSNNSEVIGSIKESDISDIDLILSKSHKAYCSWKKVLVKDRANILRKVADLFEENKSELIALCMKEAGKVLSDVVAEVREAIDFCRYYATQAEKLMTSPIKLPSITGESNNITLHPKGVFACISPWNFPLAIFTGQIAAALVAGNSVIAKPAEQTPLIATKAVELFYKAGIPTNVLQLLIGSGSVLGSYLIKQEIIKGVCFTGSTFTAKNIQRLLANRDDEIITLIAETGGQNCMIADSSALLEQLSDDVISSAFSSAGQRCSALRILLLPESTADEALSIIKESMQELEIGNPHNLSTDIGPVIDEKAQKSLQNHSDKLEKSSHAKLIAKLEVPKEGSYFPPQIWEIDDLSILEGENFGPILHVLRYKKEEMSELLEKVNSLKFGLTFGMHTRIHEQYQNIENRVNVGNIYINRNITGAVVGSQPFGGEGLSGTGFKAGGPHYLLKFVHERTVTINMAAIGGNIDLLMKS